MFLSALLFDDICRGFQHLFDDNHGAMRLPMWHPCQKDVASCLLQLLDRIDETHPIAPHQSCWLRGRSSILSLCLKTRRGDDIFQSMPRGALKSPDALDTFVIWGSCS